MSFHVGCRREIWGSEGLDLLSGDREFLRGQGNEKIDHRKMKARHHDATNDGEYKYKAGDTAWDRAYSN